MGSYVKADTRLAALVPLDSVHIDANFKETQLAHLRPGQQVRLAVDAFPEHDIKGTIQSIAPASGSVFSLLPPENATGNFTKIVQRVPVRIAVDPEALRQGLLRPGLSVVVDVDTAHRAGPSRRWPSATANGPVRPGLPPLDKRRLVTFIFMVFGMFMAILDIQIVSASLAEIQAGLSASADEISWVQTSYLIAEVIMIPLSGMLSRVLSTRWMFTISAGGFTVMSLLCATATSIDQMIVYRTLQGFIGGGMIPTVFASAYTIFRGRQALISPVIGLVATLAPTIGPTIGGYLTDLFSWHWLFLVNVGPGIAVTMAAFLLIDFDEPDLGLLRGFDWVGLGLMAAMLGSLEYVLEEGPVTTGLPTI